MPEMIHMACGSDGLAAGNTLEEALVQGMSEIYEHIIWDRIYDDTDIKTPCIDIFKIDISEELKNKGKILLD
jgi:ribosomal protein S12 methylthiotransferase accessory factor YcaO